jgi:hypothetical protein
LPKDFRLRSLKEAGEQTLGFQDGQPLLFYFFREQKTQKQQNSKTTESALFR